MCGIAGIISRPGSSASTLTQKLDAMASALAHRGPDGQHSWLSPSGVCGLTHRRLAIIDLSAAADQPMLARGGRYALTFNGELYNYIELRRALIQEGATFSTHSDSEVLLEALIRWGVAAALPRFVGMFAFALWDEGTRELTLGRDPAGEKPLYYRHSNGEFQFASELKSLRTASRADWSINRQAVSHYLSFGYVPSPYVIWNEASAVPAAHWLRLDANGAVHVEAYWHSPLRRQTIDKSHPQDAALRELLADAVKLRLRADVPIGIFLSGGIDSGLITALAAQSSNRIKTFSIGFEGQADETSEAARVAARYGTKHEVLLLRPAIGQLLNDVGKVFDTPLADPACLLTYAIAEVTRRHVTVVLNGEGSDEMFAGYRRHLATRWTVRLGLQSGPIRAIAASGDSLLPHSSSARSAYGLARRGIRGLALDEANRYMAWGTDAFFDHEKAALLAYPAESSALLIEGKLEDMRAIDPLRRFMALDFEMAMSDGLLPKLDLATMAHGLEGRCPFLDHRLIELAARYDAATLLAGNRTKAPLRRLAEDLLPPGISTAAKRGFELPLVQWLRGPLRDLARDLCLRSGGIADTLLRRPAVEAVLDRKPSEDEARWARRVYTLLSLANWHSHHA
jgi:asparagine synthase (glutamine-hydrolysing)